MKFIIGGVCGIGKTTVSKMLADRYGITHLDLDEVRSEEMAKRKGEVSPCSIGFLNLEKCLKNKLDDCQKGFVVDMGGDSIFRSGKDNEDRLTQVQWLKSAYNAKVIILMAERRVVHQRFLKTKNRQLNEFDAVWNRWEDIEESFWSRCADKFIDTTFLTPEDIITTFIET